MVLCLHVQFVRRGGVSEVGGDVVVDAGPLNQFYQTYSHTRPSAPFLCHDGNHPALFKVNLLRGWPVLLFVRVCDYVNDSTSQ